MYFNNVIVPRIAGALEGPNQLAGYLEIGVAVLAAFACARPRWEFSVALGLAVLADILTFSRSGLIGSAVSIAVVAFVYRRVAIRLVAPLATALLAGAATTAGWATSAHVSTANVLRISGNGDFVSGTTYAGGVGSRSELWRAALALWKQHPLFGVGAGNFELDLPRVGLFGVRTHANSLYIQALVEGGIPLLAATLFFVWTSIASFVRRASASPLVTAALAASIALALHQTVDFVVFYPKVGEMWWIVLALGAACV
jgi:O-antigen ligase